MKATMMIKRPALVLIILLCFGCFTAEAKLVRIAVVSDDSIQKGDVSVAGLKDFLSANGYKEGSAVKYDEYSVADKSAFSRISSINYDLICVVGTNAALAAKSAIKDKPIVFLMVVNPAKSKLVNSIDSPGANITGASLDVPVDIQLKLLKKVLPDQTKIGVIYGAYSSSIIDSAKSLEGELNIKLVPVSVSDVSEVPHALDSLKGKMDVLWLLYDGTVCTKDSLLVIITSSVKNKFPIMGFAPNLVRAGALLSYSYDPQDIGSQAGELALKILNGEEPGALAVTVPRKAGYVLNLKTAEYLDIKLSSNIIKGADYSY